MPLLRSILALALALVTFRSAAVEAQAPDANPAAREAFEAGREAYDRGRFQEALSHYERAYALSRLPKLLFNIGRAAESEGDMGLAIDAYEQYLQKVPNADNREFVEARLDRLRKLSGSSGSTAPAAPLREPEPAPAPPAYSAPPGAVVTPVPTQAPVERPGPGRFRVFVGPSFGFGGNQNMSVDGVFGAESVDYDLDTSFGFQAGFEYLPSRYFGLAAEMRYFWFRAEAGADLELDRDAALDVTFKPTGRLPLSSIPLEIYAGLPVGLTSPSLSTSEDGATWDEKEGATFGIVTGATYFVTDHIGANLELGYRWHWFRGTPDIQDEEIKFKLRQFALALNGVFAFGRPAR